MRASPLLGIALAIVGFACTPVIVPPPPPPPPAPVPCIPQRPSVDEVQRDLVARYNARDAAGSHALLDASFQRTATLEDEPAWIEGVLSKGRLDDVKRVGGDGDTRGVYEVKAERGAWRLTIDIDDKGKIVSLLFDPIAGEAAPEVARSKVPLGLPFRGEWLVFWGGDSDAVNAHITGRTPSQRRAADLDKVDAAGKVHRGDGKRNTDHYCYGAEILAVADGTVVTAIDGVHDNEPGATNPFHTSGNMVILFHGAATFSMVGHLKAHSVRVREGEKVKRGAVLGQCGNSGSSSQPHLHFQLQDGPLMEASSGIEAVFWDVRVSRGGAPHTPSGYTFLKGDRIAPAH